MSKRTLVFTALFHMHYDDVVSTAASQEILPTYRSSRFVGDPTSVETFPTKTVEQGKKYELGVSLTSSVSCERPVHILSLEEPACCRIGSFWHHTACTTGRVKIIDSYPL